MQALADYAAIVVEVKKGNESSPVISVGGSLAGTLTTFMRVKYPTVLARATLNACNLAVCACSH